MKNNSVSKIIKKRILANNISKWKKSVFLGR